MKRAKNKIGVHAFVWSPEKSLQSFDAILRQTREAGYDLIELSNIDPNTLDIDALRRLIERHELDVSVTMGMPEAGDISSDDPAVVANGRRMLEDAVSLVRDLGGSKIGGIIHASHGFCTEPPTLRAWETSVETMAQVAEKAAKSEVSLNVEIVNRFENNMLNSTAQGLEYIADTGASNVFLLLDTFHLNIEEPDIGLAIRNAGDKIGYFHFGESHRGYLGTGCVNFDAAFDALIAIDYRNEVTFEAFSSSVSDDYLSIKTATWRNIWHESAALADHAHRYISLGLETADLRAQLSHAKHRPDH